MKKITMALVLVCLVALPLVACSTNNPTTTTTPTPMATATTTTSMAPTDASSPEPSVTPGVAAKMTHYLHGKITKVEGENVSLSDVPKYGTCTIKVDTSTQLVGVTKVDELKENQLVIVGYATPEMGLGVLPEPSDVAGMSDAATSAADAMTTTAAPSASPDASASPMPSATPGASAPENMVATTVEVVETLPTLSGKVTEVDADAFVIEDTAEGKVKVVCPQGTLMEGMDQPAVDDTVTVVYSGQIAKSNPAQVTAISVTKGAASPQA